MLFTIKNEIHNNKIYKIFNILGIKFKFKKRSVYSDKLNNRDKEIIINENFKQHHGYYMDFKNPKTFSEKIQWMKIYDNDPLLTLCSDKYKVRNYVSSKIGNEYLIPLLGVYDNPYEIDFDALPDSFVIKVNWGSGQNIIVKDKTLIDINEVKEKLTKWLQPFSNHYYYLFEWCYKDIKPKIIIEKYLHSMDNSALDYKFLCFKGEPRYCWVSNKYKKPQERSFYDMNWVMQDIELVEAGKIKASIPLPKPENFEQMVQIAKILSQDFEHVRVDLYKLDDNDIKFGELTFNTSSGLSQWSPKNVDLELGNLISIEDIIKKHKKNNNKYLNSFLKNIKPYKAASHKIWTLNKDEKKKALKLDWNEATIPPSPKVISRLKELVELGDFYNLYPATENKKIIDLLSEYTGLKEDNLQYFASSDSIHEYITKAFIGVGDNVIIQAPSYDNFRLTAQANGANIIFSEIDSDFKFNPKKFEKDIDKYKPVFIYISNPNNPIGYVHETEYIEHLLKKYKNIMFLIDEAYFEFSGITSSSLVTKYQNILITRTLSKAFAIANFRFGYLISSKENIADISKIRNPKNITTLTQEAAICALSDIDYMKKYVGEVNSAKEYFINELAKKYSAFIKVYKSHSNFVVLKFQNYEMKMDFYDYLKNNFIYVRILSQSPLLNTSLRITVGTLSQMKHVLEVIDNFFRNKNKKNNIDKNDKIALFDFCNTIVDFSTADEFVNFVRKKKRLPSMTIKNNFRKLFNLMHLTEFIQKHTNKHVHKLWYLSQLKGLSRSEIELFAKDYYEKCIKPGFVKETIEEIYKLKKLGYKLYVVSGGYDVYLKYFIKEFNFDGLICTKIDFKNDKVTGKFDGYDCLNDNKIILLKRYFNRENLINYKSVAYSDSITDLPLLNYCQKGVVLSENKSEKWVKENDFEEIIWQKK